MSYDNLSREEYGDVWVCSVLSRAITFRIPFRIYLSHRITEVTLRKQAYSNTLKILPPKNENF